MLSPFFISFIAHAIRPVRVLMNPFTMRSKQLQLFVSLLTLLAFFSCNRKIEDYTSEPLSDYLPLQPGKYITYRLDSTIFTNFGTGAEIHSYQEKHVVDAQITDALGRPAYRILKYVRDGAGTKPWAPAGSYYIVPNTKTIEVVDNNLRYVKLALPVKQGFTWKGNEYLNNEPFASSYSFQNDDDMSQWNYTYTNLNDSFTYNQQKLPNVLRVLQKDDRIDLDTVRATNNTANLPDTSKNVWLIGQGTDTIKIDAKPPVGGNENLTIYNQTNTYVSLNGIRIPPSLGFAFEYANGKWYYPNTLTVTNNKVTIPSYFYQTYIAGHATDTIKVDVLGIDTSVVKKITIYNRSDGIAKFNFKDTSLNKYLIPAGLGRTFEIYNRKWRLLDNADIFLTTDPYFASFPAGVNSYAYEKYAKGIGLVYQELDMWDYQPPNGANPDGSRTGFEVRRTMIDHN